MAGASFGTTGRTIRHRGSRAHKSIAARRSFAALRTTARGRLAVDSAASLGMIGKNQFNP